MSNRTLEVIEGSAPTQEELLEMASDLEQGMQRFDRAMRAQIKLLGYGDLDVSNTADPLSNSVG